MKTMMFLIALCGYFLKLGLTFNSTKRKEETTETKEETTEESKHLVKPLPDKYNSELET